jgi:hypothetical protein
MLLGSGSKRSDASVPTSRIQFGSEKQGDGEMHFSSIVSAIFRSALYRVAFTYTTKPE